MCSLGIECGASSSKAVLAFKETDGKIQLRYFSFGPGNYALISEINLINLLASLRNLIDPHVGNLKINAIGIGMPGVLTSTDKDNLSKILKNIWPDVAKIWVGSDLETALAHLKSLTKNEAPLSVILVCGTGSCAYGTNGKDTLKLGGYGQFIGDRGSGYDIVRKYFRAHLKSKERDIEHSSNLMEELKFYKKFQELNIGESLEDFAKWSSKASKDEIASFVPLILEKWESGEKIAEKVVISTIKNLALDTIALIKKLSSGISFENQAQVSLGLTGSIVAKNHNFSSKLIAQISENLPPNFKIEATIMESTVLGALHKIQNLGENILEPLKTESISNKELKDKILPIATDLSETEKRNPLSMTIDKMSISEAINLWLSQESSIYSQIAKESRIIENLVKRVSESFKSGGRLFYTGAGTSGRLGILDASECPPTFKSPPHWVQGIIAGGEKAIRNAVEGAEGMILFFVLNHYWLRIF